MAPSPPRVLRDSLARFGRLEASLATPRHAKRGTPVAAPRLLSPVARDEIASIAGGLRTARAVRKKSRRVESSSCGFLLALVTSIFRLLSRKGNCKRKVLKKTVGDLMRSRARSVLIIGDRQ